MYQRTSRELAFDALNPSLRDAIRKHAAERQVPLEPTRLRVFVTHSVNPPGTGFVAKLLGRRANPVDPDPEHESAPVLQPTQLFVATTRASRGTVVLSLPLVLASVVRGSGVSARLAAAVPGADDGLTISGFPGDEGRPGTYFFGVAKGPVLDACFAAVEEAIANVKRG